MDGDAVPNVVIFNTVISACEACETGQQKPWSQVASIELSPWFRKGAKIWTVLKGGMKHVVLDQIFPWQIHETTQASGICRPSWMGYRYLKHNDEVDVDLFIVCDSSWQASSRNLMPYFVGHHERSAPLVMMMMVMVKIRIIILMILMIRMPFLYKLPKKVIHGLTCSFYGANNVFFVLR